MTPPETVTVAVELAELRGEIRTGLSDIKGSLRVLVERTERTDQDVRQLRVDTEKDLAALKENTEKEVAGLRADVESLKKARWPLPAVSVLAAIAAVIVAVMALYR